MESAFTERWLQETSTDDDTSAVAVRTLESRLGAVLHYLPLAAKKVEEDLEYVHHLRVWTRRATAALGLYEDWLPRRRFRWMKKQLRKVRRAANDARDCDVLIERLKKRQSSHDIKRWLETVQAERKKAQNAIVQVQERLWQDNRFARRIGKLLQRVRLRGKAGARSDRFGDWARECLRSIVQQFFDARLVKIVRRSRKQAANCHLACLAPANSNELLDAISVSVEVGTSKEPPLPPHAACR